MSIPVLFNYISMLNVQLPSLTVPACFRINESCPVCSKPLMGGESVEAQSGASRQPMAQRICRSCRGKIGTCFLCHQPVKGVFVWCPGCGHGGHLDHALEWYVSFADSSMSYFCSFSHSNYFIYVLC